MFELRHSLILSAFVAGTTLMLSAPAFAQAPAPMTGSMPAPAAATEAPKPHGDPLDAHIAALHENLQITAAEEKQWKALAAVMRHNAEVSRDLVNKKLENVETMTAVEDLQNYADVAEAHAQGLKRLTKAFAALYAVMPDDQKKVADEHFRTHKRDAKAAHETN
jgi:hypothetical protein